MAVKTFQTRIKLKYDESSKWTGSSLVLLTGEVAIDSSNYNIKIGDGSSTFANLPYLVGGAKLAGWVADISSNTAIAATDTLETALHKLENKVNAATTGGITGITMNGGNITVTNNIAALGDQVTTFGGQNGAITLGNGLQMGTGSSVKEVSVKVDSNNANGLSVGSGGLSLATVVASTSGTGGSNGAMTAAQAEKLAGIETGAQANVLEGVQVNGTDLLITSKKVNVTVAEGSTDGTIAVNGADVAVHGLGSAAYKDTAAFEAAFSDGEHDVATMSAHTPGTGEIATQKIEFFNGTQTGGSLGTSSSASETLYFKSAVTAANPIVTNSDLSGIVGAMVYKGTVDGTHALPTADVQPGWTYVVSQAGTYANIACEVGDMIIAKNSTPDWNVISGENQVINAQATITAGNGTYTTIATVDGETITAKVSVTAGNATIASVADGVVTLKAGVTQGTGTGTIANSSDSDIILKKVATTGSANDITVTDAVYGGGTATTNAQTALTNLSGAISDIKTSIEGLDATVDADETSGTSPVTQSVPASDFNVLNSVAEANGKLTGGTAYTLKKVAATGAAADVALTDTGNNYTSDNVEGALAEIPAWLLILDCGTATTVTHTSAN